MRHIKDETEIDFNKSVVVKFSTEWCMPCKKMDKLLEKMDKEFQDIEIYSVDAEKFNKLAQSNKIMSVPTLVFYRQGKEVDRMVGLVMTEALRKTFRKFEKEGE